MELRIENLSKVFKEKRVLDSINLKLPPGIYGLLGAKGAGKTKLLEILLGLIEADYGSFYINQDKISREDGDYKTMLGYLPKDFMAYPELSLYEYMLYIGNLKGLETDGLEKYILDLLNRLELLEYKDSKTEVLNYGQMKRLGLAQALINDPRILLLDEPTAGLEDDEGAKLSNIIYSLKEDRIIVVSTHIVEAIQYIVDKIIILKNGKIIDFGNNIEVSKILIDRVWESGTDLDEAKLLESKYLVTKLEPQADEFKIRIISEDEPTGSWEKVYPSLMDIYLYHFGQVN